MKHLSILVPDSQTNLSTVACIAGAYEILTEADAIWVKAGKASRFNIELVSASKMTRSHGELFAIKSHKSILDIPCTHLIIIPSSLVRSYDSATVRNQALIRWIETQYHLGAEVASMCTGAFMLASTGLLDGQTCSTHWSMSEKFKALYPAVYLQTEKLITDENRIYTNGGAYSFLHLIIYLIEKHYDRQTAIYCAKIFQIDMERDMQSEFSIFNGQKKHGDDTVLKAQKYIEKNYRRSFSIGSLSDILHVGRRNFDRRFIKATTLTPLDYLQRVRIEAAKKSFENSRKTVTEVMYEVGYYDMKAFRDVFSRVSGMSPTDYKSRYNKMY